jgi:hypothetical protein
LIRFFIDAPRFQAGSVGGGSTRRRFRLTRLREHGAYQRCGLADLKS